MAELFRFWRTMPRASVGLIVLFELIAVSLGRDGLSRVGPAIQAVRQTLGEATTGVLLTLGVIALAALGTELARALLLPARYVAGWFLRKLGSRSEKRHLTARTVMAYPPLALTWDIYRAHRQFFSDYYLAWSLGTAQTPEFYDIIQRDWETHFARFDDVLGEVANGPQELWRVAFFTSVTQEQALADYVESTLETMQTAWLALLLCPIVALRVGGSLTETLATGLIAAAIAALLTPMYVRRKLTFAVYLIYTHAVTFQFGELAEIADREAT